LGAESSLSEPPFLSMAEFLPDDRGIPSSLYFPESQIQEIKKISLSLFTGPVRDGICSGYSQDGINVLKKN
jgi:hypothetical protein